MIKIKTLIRSNIIFLISIIIFLILHYIFYFRNDSVLLGGEGNYWLDYSVYLKKSGYTWLNIAAGVVATSLTTIIIFPIILSFIRNITVNSFLITSANYLLPYIFMYLLLSTMSDIYDSKLSKVFIVLLSIFYVFNPFSLNYLYSLNPWSVHILFMYPLVLLVSIIFFEDNFKLIVILGTIFFVFAYTLTNPPQMALFIIFLPMIVLLARIIKRGRISWIFLFKDNIVVFISLIIFSIWWLTNWLIVRADIKSIYTLEFARSWLLQVKINTPYIFKDIFSLMWLTPNIKNFNFFSKYYNLQLINILLFIPILIIFYWMIIFYKNSKNKKIVILLLVNIIAISFFLKGANPPFGNIMLYCFSYIPFCYIFKTAPEKFGVLYVFVFTLLLFFVLKDMPKKLAMWLFSFYILILLIPFSTGNYLPEYKTIDGYLISRKYNDWSNNKNFRQDFNNKKLDFRLLSFPNSGNYQILSYMENGKYYSGNDPYLMNLPQAYIADYSGTKYWNLFMNLDNHDYERFLSLYSIKYVHLNKNIISWFGNISKKTLYQLDTILKNKFNLKVTYGNMSLYNNNLFLPHFYTPLSLITSNQNVDSLPQIISQSDYKIRSAIFFENQNQTKSEGLKVIKSIKSEAEKGVATEAAKIAEEVAQCVTGDTILRRRRKKSKVKSQKSKVTGGWDPEDFEDVRIDEIEEGDEILTLDEKSGRFVTQKVKKLMGLGVKPIIKLTTSSGKTIRTTAQHPYLTLTDAKQAFAFIDEVGVGRAPDQPIFGVASLYTDDSLALNRKLHDIFTGAVSAYNTNESRFEFKFNAVTGNNLRFFRAIVKTLAEDDSWSFAAILTKKNRGWNYWNAYLNYLKKLIIRAPFAKLTVVADYLAKPKTAQKNLETVTRLDKVAHLLQLESQGSLLLQVADILLGALHFEERQKEMGLTSGKEAKVKLVKMVKTLLAKKITAIECLHAVTNNLPQILPAVKNDRQRWIKVKDLSEGALIATKDGWERIIKIKHLSAKQVYDIEVEGTHNFIGNGIVAHNTYVDGNSKLKTQNSNLSGERSNTITNTPILEFKKVNPTKYKVLVHGAKEAFPLVFSESFHEGWKLYVGKVNGLTGSRVYPERSRRIDGLKDYKILDGNEEDQASEEELSSFIDKGWVTTLGDGNPKKKFGIFSGAGEKEIKHMKYENGKERLDYVEKYRIDFVSKNFQDTIQNDNLPKGPIWETWLAGKLKGSRVKGFTLSAVEGLTSLNKNVIQIPDDNHLMVNGYANSWIIDPNEICSSNPELPTSNYCIQNPDGTYDMELVIEFWPQRLFYIGLAISGLTLLGCIGYLIYDWRKGRNKLKFIEIDGNSSMDNWNKIEIH